MSPTPISPFLKPNDPLLSKRSIEVEFDGFNSSQIQADIETMLKVAYGEQTKRMKPILVGLAAPQIGISKRIILVDVAADGKGGVGDLRLYINPEIIESSGEENDWYEGCFSTDRVCGIVSRPTRITLRGYVRGISATDLGTGVGIDATAVWNLVEETYSGYTARIFQHEIDHLNGKEFVTHITDDNKLHWVEKDEFPAYRNAGGWKNWPNKCSREKWQDIKGLRK